MSSVSDAIRWNKYEKFLCIQAHTIQALDMLQVIVVENQKR